MLLVEGDSDPILVYPTLQKLVETGNFDLDLNPLAVVGTGDARHAEAIARILMGSANPPEIAFLFDGDQGGNDRAAAVKKFVKIHDLKSRILSKGTTIEDHIPLSGQLYREATTKHVAAVSENVDKKAIRLLIEKSFTEEFGDESKVTNGIAKWARVTGKEAGELTEEPSSVGIAREYSLLLADAPAESLDQKYLIKRSVVLSEWIGETLNLSRQTISQEAIFEEPA